MNLLVSHVIAYLRWIRANMEIELLEAVKASLRAKMALLAEDNWMYEAEEDNSLR